jgi:acyl-coenzyme A thioesterase 9
MLAPLRPVDLRLSGQVIHVGTSSIDVVVRLEALGKDGNDTDDSETLMLGSFVYVHFAVID